MLKLSPIIVRFYSFRSAKFSPHKYVPSEFEKKWESLPEYEQKAIESNLHALECGDWRHLTKDQKRNTQPPPRTMTPEYQAATEEYLKEVGTVPKGFHIQDGDGDQSKNVKL